MLEIIDLCTIVAIVGRKKMKEIIRGQSTEFLITTAALLAHKEEATKLMWASGYYNRSDMARLFQVTRACTSIWVSKIKKQTPRLSWYSYRDVQLCTKIAYAIDRYITEGKLVFRYPMGRPLISKAEVKEIEKKFPRTHPCPICLKPSEAYYCGNACKQEAKRRRIWRQHHQKFTLETCPAWALELFQLSHSGKHYGESDLVPYDQAAEMINLHKAAIFRWMRVGLLQAFQIASRQKNRTRQAIPREQVELLGKVHPYFN